MKKAKVVGIAFVLVVVASGAAYFATRPKIPPVPVAEGGPRPPGVSPTTSG
ncbi:MAG: hypothetical protein JNM74_23185, partial [Myxococcales bacterium]|nr:hypothetical protein [Myxococcales bacterium]